MREPLSKILVIAIFITIAYILSGCPPLETENVTIYRDTYGVPHIYGESLRATLYGAGYTDAQDQVMTVARQALFAQGRLAEFFGEGSIGSDKKARFFGFKSDADDYYGDLDKITKNIIEAYVDGYNKYISENRKSLPDWVERLSKQAVLAILLSENNRRALMNVEQRELEYLKPSQEQEGSNEASLDDKRTAYGVTIGYGDPHVPWGDSHREAHLVGPDFDLAGHIEGPFLTAFTNQYIAVAGTSNVPDGGDVYVEKLKPGDQYSYWDWEAGGYLPMRLIRDEEIKVKGASPCTVKVYETRPGRMVFHWENAQSPTYAYSIRLAIQGLVEVADEMVRLARASSVNEFREAMAYPAKSKTSRAVADVNGDIGYFYTGRVPQRNKGYDYGEPLDGTDPGTEWLSGIWSFDQAPLLPFVVNPDGGFVQNCNDAPWWSTNPQQIVGREDWLDIIVPEEVDTTGRGLRLRELLSDDNNFVTMEYMIDKVAFDTYVYHANLFIQAIERGWDMWGSELDPTPNAAELDRILRDWGNPENGGPRADVDAEGMTVMFLFKRSASSVRWPEDGYTPTKDEMQGYIGLLDEIALYMIATYQGRIHVPWGEIHRYQRGGRIFQLAGGTGSVSSLLMSDGASPGSENFDPVTGLMECNRGSSYIHLSLMELGNIRMYTVSPNGQIGPEHYPDSPHVTDQTELFANLKVKELWRHKDEIEGNLCPYTDPDHPRYDPDHEHKPVTTLDVPKKESEGSNLQRLIYISF